MPELPEIETIRRGLGPLISGRRILGVEVRERRLREPIAARALMRLRGAAVTGIRRRSKYLLVDTDSGLTLLIHLGMTGQLWVADTGRPQRPHEHVVFALDDGRELRFVDARRFGLLRLLRSDLAHRAPRRRKRPVKNFLMDTRAIAGVGNIYACEALYRCGLNPKRAVGRISRAV